MSIVSAVCCPAKLPVQPKVAWPVAAEYADVQFVVVREFGDGDMRQ